MGGRGKGTHTFPCYHACVIVVTVSPIRLTARKLERQTGINAYAKMSTTHTEWWCVCGGWAPTLLQMRWAPVYLTFLSARIHACVLLLLLLLPLLLKESVKIVLQHKSCSCGPLQPNQRLQLSQPSTDFRSPTLDFFPFLISSQSLWLLRWDG